MAREGAQSTGRKPLTLMKRVSQSKFPSVSPSTHLELLRRPESVLDGRDLERKRLGWGGVGLEDGTFLNGPCLCGLGQDQG